MSLHGLTKGTGLEKITETMAMGEAHGVMMYYALARLAKEQGYDFSVGRACNYGNLQR